MIRKELENKFNFRMIRQEEAEQAVQMEDICFPPQEACDPEKMRIRVRTVPELFLVAEDKKTGRLAGLLNGISTNEEKFKDYFFTDISKYVPEGKNVMLTGLEVLPEYRGMHLASAIMELYQEQERKKGRQTLILTCLEEKVPMYEKMGFVNKGYSASSWGNEKWYEMICEL